MIWSPLIGDVGRLPSTALVIGAASLWTMASFPRAVAQEANVSPSSVAASGATTTPPPAGTTATDAGPSRENLDLLSGPPINLEVSRRDLTNFLVDPIARTPYQVGEDQVRDLQSAFIVGASNIPYVYFWDPLTCRLLGVMNVKAPVPPAPETPSSQAEPSSAASSATPSNPPQESQEGGKSEASSEVASPYELMATGALPFTAAMGSQGNPQYFGFELVHGKPQFLYMHGGLIISERIWFDEGGGVLRQVFMIREPKEDVVLTVPEAWVKKAKASVGTWRGNTLRLTKEQASEFALSFQLSQPSPAPATAVGSE